VVLIGEEVAQYDGACVQGDAPVCGTDLGTKGLWTPRSVKRPLSEWALALPCSVSAGSSSLMFWSFATVAYDQIVNNAGQIRYMSGV
jgi:pyruvate dehydrogenase E1 component subunit beta